MYIVVDFYENPFGDRIYVNDSEEDCKEFCRMYEEDTDGECKLEIIANWLD